MSEKTMKMRDISNIISMIIFLIGCYLVIVNTDIVTILRGLFFIILSLFNIVLLRIRELKE